MIEKAHHFAEYRGNLSNYAEYNFYRRKFLLKKISVFPTYICHPGGLTSMLKDFVTNASLMVASFFIIGQYYKKNPLTRSSTWNIKLTAGLLLGLLGILLMLNGIPLGPGVVADLRHVPIILAALQGGPVPAIVSAFVMVAARMTLFGGATFSAAAASVNLVLIAVLCGLLAGNKGATFPRFLLLNALCMICISAVLSINLNHIGQLQDIPRTLTYHWTFSLLVGTLAVYVYLHILRSHAFNLKLVESEERYRRLIASSPDATLVHSDETILFVNDKGIKLLGAVSRKEVLGRSVFDFVHPDYWKDQLRLGEAVRAGQETTDLHELKYITLDGREIFVELSISPIVYKENPAYLTTVREITDRKLTEKKLQEALAALQKLSDLDGLTGIPNRRKLDHFLSRCWSEAAAEHTPVSGILFDVDYFKSFNDTYGHQGGDEVLKCIALAAFGLLQNTRHLIARYGGEEFMVVLPRTGAEEAFGIAESLRRAVESLDIPHSVSGTQGRVTISLGVATLLPAPDINEKDLIRMADQALYRAKAEGRNKVSVCAEEPANPGKTEPTRL